MPRPRWTGWRPVCGEGLPPAQRPPALAVYPELGIWPGSQDTLTGPLLLLSIVTALLMLVVCANLGGLLLVKTAARQEEIGVRLALGVTRSRLVRQLLTESVALSLARRRASGSCWPCSRWTPSRGSPWGGSCRRSTTSPSAAG